MSVTHDRRRTAMHEGGHTAALIIGGRLPVRVTADQPKQGVEGEVVVDHGDRVTPDSAAEVVISVLMGPLAAGEPSWPPEWPPDRAAAGDEGQLAAGLRYLKVDDEADYHELVALAHVLVRTREFQRIARLVARASELRDELDTDDLRRLLGPDLLRAYDIPNPKED